MEMRILKMAGQLFLVEEVINVSRYGMAKRDNDLLFLWVSCQLLEM